MLTAKRAAGGVLIVIGALALWEGLRFPFGTLARPGPAYLPVVLSLVLITFGAVLMTVGGSSPRLAGAEWGDWRRATSILAVCAFIAATLERLGWRLSVAVALLVLLGVLERRGAVFSLVVTLAIAVGSFYLFNDVLNVPLPRGAWGF